MGADFSQTAVQTLSMFSLHKTRLRPVFLTIIVSLLVSACDSESEARKSLLSTDGRIQNDSLINETLIQNDGVDSLLITGRTDSDTLRFWQCELLQKNGDIHKIQMRFWQTGQGAAGSRYFDWATLDEAIVQLAFENSQTTLSNLNLTNQSLTATDSFENSVSCTLEGPNRNSVVSDGILLDDDTGLRQLLLQDGRSTAEYDCVRNIAGVASTIDTVVFESSGNGTLNGQNVEWQIDERSRLRFSGTETLTTWFDILPTGLATPTFTAKDRQTSLTCTIADLI